VRVGRQHVRDGVITLRTEKRRKGKEGEQVTIPILPPLAASITATKTGDLAFLATAAGRPWVKESFGNWFREAARAAGCPGAAHGLRKAGATRAAEAGATPHPLPIVSALRGNRRVCCCRYDGGAARVVNSFCASIASIAPHLNANHLRRRQYPLPLLGARRRHP